MRSIRHMGSRGVISMTAKPGTFPAGFCIQDIETDGDTGDMRTPLVTNFLDGSLT